MRKCCPKPIPGLFGTMSQEVTNLVQHFDSRDNVIRKSVKFGLGLGAQPRISVARPTISS